MGDLLLAEVEPVTDRQPFAPRTPMGIIDL